MTRRAARATLNVMTTKSLLLTEFGGSVSADVDAPADDVFALLTDTSRLPEWNARIRRVLEPAPAVLGRDRGRLGRTVAPPTAVDLHEILARGRVKVLLADPARDRDGDADLPQVLGAALALAEVSLDKGTVVRAKDAVEVVR